MKRKKIIKKQNGGGFFSSIGSALGITGGSSGTPSSPLGKASNIMGGIGAASDFASSFIPPKSEYSGEKGAITQGLDAGYDAIANSLMSVPGWGCVCAGTKVFDKDGRCVNIEDLCQDDGIIGWADGKVKPQTIAAFIEPHEKECVEITLQCGAKLRCSTDHPIFAAKAGDYKVRKINDIIFKFKKFDFIPAEKLPKDIFVGLANGVDIWGNNKDGKELGDYIYYNDELPEDPYGYTKEAICEALTILIDKLADIRFISKERSVKLIFAKVNKDVINWIEAQLIKLGIYAFVNDYPKLKKTTFNIKNIWCIANLCEKLDLYYGSNIKKLIYVYKIIKDVRNRNTSKYNGIIDSQIVSIESIGKQMIYNLQADTDHTYLANGIITHNTIAGGAMKIAGLGNKLMSAVGGGTDGMTTVDAILGSSFLGLDPLSLINGFGGQKADTFSKDLNTFAQIGSSYGGSDAQADYASSMSGKKYGLFSSAARHRANAQIAEAKRQQGIMADIANTAEMQNNLTATMTDTLAQRRKLALSGGYQQGAIHAAKHGMRLFFSDSMLKKTQDILKRQEGGPIIDIQENEYKIEEPSEEWIIKQDKIDNFLSMIQPLAEINPELPDQIASLDYDEIDQIIDRLEEEGITDGQEMADWFVEYFKNKEGNEESEEDKYQIQESEEESEQSDENDENNPEKFQNGGQMSVIPDGSLHAHKHDIINEAKETNPDLELKGNITKKGIPVVAIEEGGKVEQQAEVEREELILSKECTDSIEELRQKYHSEESQAEKDRIATEAGKILVEELSTNLDDRANLMEKVEE